MITAIIRKPTPTLETIYADDKKNGTPRKPINVLQRSTTFLSKKRTRVRFRAVNALKEKSRKLKQFFR
jgi:hypothetical protein